jgi:SNF2 family DNA or RNA helicase
MMVCDECQGVKNIQGAQFSALRHIQRMSTLLLSSTVIANRYVDLYAPLKLIGNIPITSRGEFKSNFGSTQKPTPLQKQEVGKRSKPKQVAPTRKRARRLQHLLNRVIIARPTALLHLPGIVVHTEIFELNKVELAESHTLMEKYFELVSADDVKASANMVTETGGDDDDNRLGLATKALRASCHLLLIKKGWNNPHQRAMLMKKLWRHSGMAANSSRVRHFLEYFKNDEKRFAGEKSLIFSNSTDFLDILEIAIKQEPGLELNCLHYDGRTPINERQGVINEFNASLNRPLLITREVGGTGLNMQGASRVYRMEVWWNGTWDEQADGRAHRTGQINVVKVVRFQAESALADLHIAKVNQVKRAENMKILRGMGRKDEGVCEIFYK